MKNLKLILTSFPVIALVIFLYFATSGFYQSNHVLTKVQSKENKSEINSDRSTTMNLHIIITSSSSRCLVPPYNICINGQLCCRSTLEEFDIKIPCDEEITICIYSASSPSCTDTYTNNFHCTAGGATHTFNLSDLNPPCDCN
jgi:hypothetical protein